MNTNKTHSSLQHSKHAKTRYQQRGIKERLVQVLLEWGDCLPAGDGCEKIFCTRHTLKELANDYPKNIVDGLKGLVLIVANGSLIVTAYRDAWA